MGVKTLPKTGNRFVTTWKYVKDPYGCFREWKLRYGNTFVVRALNGDVVVTSDTENIRRIFYCIIRRRSSICSRHYRSASR